MAALIAPVCFLSHLNNLRGFFPLLLLSFMSYLFCFVLAHVVVGRFFFFLTKVLNLYKCFFFLVNVIY